MSRGSALGRVILEGVARLALLTAILATAFYMGFR